MARPPACYAVVMKISDIQGVIFDVDDTLLDNNTRDPARAGHERARRAAFHEVGRRRNIPVLTTIEPAENSHAFVTSPVHSLEGAVWNMLFIKGIVTENVIDRSNPLFVEIVQLKDEFYEKILREEAQEVPGATAFVRALHDYGLDGRLAVASSAILRDIDIFFEKTGINQFIPAQRIVAKHMVTNAKPHPEPFELAFKTLGLPETAKRNVLVFEDDPRGIQAAQAAGLPVFAITTAHDRDRLEALDMPPDFVADSFAEFAAHLGLPDLA